MRAYLLGGRPVHFPFLSGMLHYTCEGCPAPCCKSTPLGVGMQGADLRMLKKVQPKLPLFATPGYYGSPMLSIQAPREACWFLDAKTQCRLESRLGRSAKPAGCRLYPFQRVRSIGKAITLLPDFTCPIAVADKPSDEGPTSHDELCLEMHRVKLPARGHPALPPPSDLDWARAAKLEGRIVRRAHLFLGGDSYLPYAVKQQEMTAEALEVVPRADHLKRLEVRIRERVGAAPVSQAGPVHDLVALTGILRLMTSALPRADLPGLLIATEVLLEAYDDMLGVRRSARTVISLFEQRLPLLFVLSHLLDRPSLMPDADPKRLIHNMPAVRAPLLNVLQAVVDNRHAKKPKTLDRILEAEGEEFSAPLGFHGAAMLYGLGRILLAHGTFAGRATQTGPRRPVRATSRSAPR